jgi:uncharacterized protein YecE (DUF72 family)
VEIHSTFYHAPSAATVNGWARKTPDDFIFAVKVPQTITHEKMLRGADGEFKSFVETMDFLEDKLGPMVLRFPYFNPTKFKSAGEFIELLKAFMEKFPKDHRSAVQIRNRNWLDARIADALRERNVALVLQDQSWMPRPTELFEKFDPITADFTYILWLGGRNRDRRANENVGQSDCRPADGAQRVGRNRPQGSQAPDTDFRLCQQPLRRARPATVEQFQAMLGTLDEFGPTSTVKLRKVPSEKRQSTLFDS